MSEGYFDEIYREGRCAFKSGKPFEERAYNDERANESWQQGWEDARDEASEKLAAITGSATGGTD
jgi:hypothetical protein